MRKRVLLIDDSLTIHKIVELTINKEAFELFGSQNHLDGISIAAKENVDCILVDNVICSDEENYAERLLTAAPNAKIVLLVGAYDQFLDTSNNSPHVSDYIVKPFNAATLNHALETAMSQKSEPPKDAPKEEVIAPQPIKEEKITPAAPIVPAAPVVPTAPSPVSPTAGKDASLEDDVRSILGDEIADILSELETTDNPTDEEMAGISEEAAEIARQYEAEQEELAASAAAASASTVSHTETITISYKPAAPVPLTPLISPIEEDDEAFSKAAPAIKAAATPPPTTPNPQEVSEKPDFAEGIGLEVLESYDRKALSEEEQPSVTEAPVIEAPIPEAPAPVPAPAVSAPVLSAAEEMLEEPDFAEGVGLEVLESYGGASTALEAAIDFIEQDLELEMLQKHLTSAIEGKPITASPSEAVSGKSSELTADIMIGGGPQKGEDFAPPAIDAPPLETKQPEIEEESKDIITSQLSGEQNYEAKEVEDISGSLFITDNSVPPAEPAKGTPLPKAERIKNSFNQPPPPAREEIKIEEKQEVEALQKVEEPQEIPEEVVEVKKEEKAEEAPSVPSTSAPKDNKEAIENLYSMLNGENIDFTSNNVEIGTTNEKLFSAEVDERTELFSMFDGEEEKDAEPVERSAFKKIALQNNINTSPDICKLTIEITKEEFVDIFRRYLDKNTVDFLLYDTVRDAISKVLPEMVEKMIRREILKMLKG